MRNSQIFVYHLKNEQVLLQCWKNFEVPLVNVLLRVWFFFNILLELIGMAFMMNIVRWVLIVAGISLEQSDFNTLPFILRQIHVVKSHKEVFLLAGRGRLFIFRLLKRNLKLVDKYSNKQVQENERHNKDIRWNNLIAPVNDIKIVPIR